MSAVNHTLPEAITVSADELQGLCRDAERYRFMRCVVERVDQSKVADTFDAQAIPTTAAEFDAAIDSVMRAHPLREV